MVWMVKLYVSTTGMLDASSGELIGLICCTIIGIIISHQKRHFESFHSRGTPEYIVLANWESVLLSLSDMLHISSHTDLPLWSCSTDSPSRIIIMKQTPA